MEETLPGAVNYPTALKVDGITAWVHTSHVKPEDSSLPWGPPLVGAEEGKSTQAQPHLAGLEPWDIPAHDGRAWGSTRPIWEKQGCGLGGAIGGAFPAWRPPFTFTFKMEGSGQKFTNSGVQTSSNQLHCATWGCKTTGDAH